MVLVVRQDKAWCPTPGRVELHPCGGGLAMVQQLDAVKQRTILHDIDNLPAKGALKYLPPRFPYVVVVTVGAVVATKVEVQAHRTKRTGGGQQAGDVDLLWESASAFRVRSYGPLT